MVAELDENRSELTQSQTDLTKCQAELLDTHELLDTRESELEISRNDLAQRDERLSGLEKELSDNRDVLLSREQEIAEFNSHKYPERCASLQEQLHTLSSHAQLIERKVDGLEKERRALRMALLNEIDYLRTA